MEDIEVITNILEKYDFFLRENKLFSTVSFYDKNKISNNYYNFKTKEDKIVRATIGGLVFPEIFNFTGIEDISFTAPFVEDELDPSNKYYPSMTESLHNKGVDLKYEKSKPFSYNNNCCEIFNSYLKIKEDFLQKALMFDACQMLILPKEVSNLKNLKKINISLYKDVRFPKEFNDLGVEEVKVSKSVDKFIQEYIRKVKKK